MCVIVSAKTAGGILGFDFIADNNDVYGLAFGVSNANVSALVNTTNKTHILGYNLMVYGAHTLPYFVEWIEWAVSGVINKNYGVRIFGINGTDLSTSASYRSALAGGRINVGTDYDVNGIYSLSPVLVMQYVLTHQPAYDEDDSVAALHVATKNNQSILTLGAGLRMFENYGLWSGLSGLSATVTYDVLSPKQITTANFIVGSESFIMSSAPARLALKLGADYHLNICKDLDLKFIYNYEKRSGYYDNFCEIKLSYIF